MTTPEEKIKQLGLSLPPAPKPVGLYQPFVVSGKLAFLSGQISRDADGKILADFGPEQLADFWKQLEK